MTVTIIALLASALLLLVMVWKLRRHPVEVRSLDDLEGATRPIDLPAFRNLLDPAEEHFLRQRLSAKDFKEVNELRMRAALEYLGRVAHNASLLLQLGESLQAKEEAEIKVMGSTIAKQAIVVRLLALCAMAVISLNYLIPGSRLPVGRVLSAYQLLSERVRSFCYRTAPARAGDIGSIL